jgi:hypothetical protein
MLITARSLTAPTQSNKVLIVIQLKTPGQRHYATVKERNRITKVVPPESLLQLHESSPYTEDGLDATVETVLLRLPEASIFHFACHRVQNSEDPLQSALHL